MVQEGEAHGFFRQALRRGLPRAFVPFVFFVVAKSCVAFAALSAVRCRLSALFALGLCLWLRADTKPEPEPEPAAARRMVTIDGPKQRVFPLSLAAKHSFKALDLRLATEKLKAKEPDLDTTAAALLRYEGALQSIEAEVGEQ